MSNIFGTILGSSIHFGLGNTSIHPSSSESQEHSVTIPNALFDFENCEEAEKATQQRPAHLQFRTCRRNITELSVDQDNTDNQA
ncbi:uncharacterized protein LOC120724707 isoform X2 [Simochromis diagramma]|uniref:uncharacterized protein LOC120724707 isoform X2 n=1 Tax=Simochromis diagramma TaxID=43689 RepID=UPI001A7E72A8|nr:uncharacterized protein LOC120724707 isoform X2 [Simochromis diagramma]